MKVAIAGGGISGLTCAYWLHQFGIPFHLFEKEETPGGRIKTIQKNGFLLDVGFQVFLPAYPEAQRILDYEALNFYTFDAGAEIWNGKELIPFPDPIRNPQYFFKILKTPFLSFQDALALHRLFEETTNLKPEEVFGPSMGSTLEYLKELNFSKSFIEHFWRPFFTGIFLEKDLNTEARFFRFLFQCFKNSLASLPAKGMQQIPIQIASKLPSEQLHFGQTLPVNEKKDIIFPEFISDNDFRVIAFDNREIDQYNQYNGTTTLYFKTPATGRRKSIYLVAKENSLVNNIAFISDINPHYTPSQEGLVAVSVVDRRRISENDQQQIVIELYDIFGNEVAEWQLLEIFFIPGALPKMQPKLKPDIELIGNTIKIGDHTTYPSINGAMLAGRLAAEWIRDHLKNRIK